MPRPPSLPPSPVPGLKALKAELGKLGYTEEGLRDRLALRGVPAQDYFASLADPPFSPGPDGLSPLDWLIHLFLLRLPVARSELGRLLSAEALEAMEAVQLVQPTAAGLEATCALLPFDSFYLLVDFVLGAREPDAVGFPDPATLAGARMLEPTFDDQRDLAVCLHAGAGLLPLLLRSRYRYERVVVHDESPRALQLAALAAALNDLQVEISPDLPSGARSADVVAASFPGIYRSSSLWGRGPASGDGARWERPFALAAELMAEHGRAVLCHEKRTQPNDWFGRKLQPILGAGDLELAWVRIYGTGLWDNSSTEMGVSVMRRRPKDPTKSPLMHVGSLLGLPNSTARGLQLYLESRKLMELKLSEILKLAPYRNARAIIDQRYEVGPDRTLAPGQLQIGPQPWPAQAIEVLNLCDNVRTLQEVANCGENYAQLALELVVDGVMYLRQP